MSDSPSLVLNHIANSIATITLNRPQRRNALTRQMYLDLSEALQTADANTAVSAIVLTGAQGYFTAGNDLADFIGFKRGDSFEALTFLESIATLKKPLIAAVERGAVGVGATLLQHCDFAYAGKSTRFALPFANFGLCPEGGASRTLAHGAMAKQAARWLMLGDPFSAEEAVKAGLLTSVCEDDGALAHAYLTAQKLGALSTEATQTTKALIRAARPDMVQTLRLEADAFTRLLEGVHAQNAITAFANKSK